MSGTPRKKSPRAPSLPLDEAIERAIGIYEMEHRHAAPTDVIAQDLGYKSANNGSALAAIASLRYYGLLEKVQEGKLAVSKDIEAFRFAPNEDLKRTLQIKWLKSPQIFAELLDHYKDGLPSDATLRFGLIQRGFNPASAEALLNVFRKSVEYTRYFEHKEEPNETETSSASPQEDPRSGVESVVVGDSDPAEYQKQIPTDYDRVPVRLAGGRRAWLEIPSPFYSADKKRLKAQIDLLLAEDEEENELSPE